MKLKLLIFDLDGTLAASKSAITAPHALLLKKALDEFEVCILTGGTLSQINTFVVANLNLNDEKRLHLHLMPNFGTRYVKFNATEQKWVEVYSGDFLPEEVATISECLETTAKQQHLWLTNPVGEHIQDRGGQVTFSALGQLASPADKAIWRAEHLEELENMRAMVQKQLPQFEARLGGLTSIDVTRIGMDKAFGVRQILKHLNLPTSAATFFGDRLDPGGNDFPVMKTGVECVKVKDPDDTFRKLKKLH
ncbi:MAG: HAD-IIB family hydrolase [Candidatus Ancillula sp.]|jgi:HAD superfamily hydrolase (TIGR01484 family)|nr:HAD-IIB family hydrolase [Candidatus Ancillula sp.]